MEELKNIFLYEHSPEAVEALNNGNAKISPGGVIRIGNGGKGFLELAKPSQMSVADFKSLFEDKEHAKATDDRLYKMESKLAISEDGLREIEKLGWLNNIAIQRNYSITFEGFRQTLQGIECINKQLSELREDIWRNEKRKLLEEAQTYINYMNSDAGEMRLKSFSTKGSKVSDHLDQISAKIKSLLNDIENEDIDAFTQIQIVTNLLPPFTYVVRKYSSLYYYENGEEYLPGNYEEWVKVIDLVNKSKLYRNRVEYYVKLKTIILFRDKILIAKKIGTQPSKLLSGVTFEKHYIEGHNKEEYLLLDDQIRNKFKNRDCIIENGNVLIFLDE